MSAPPSSPPPETPWPPPTMTDLLRWQGSVDSFMKTSDREIRVLFEADRLQDERISLVDNKYTAMSSKLAVAVVMASFVGTVVSSLIVAAILKVFWH
jgi:hypothetical protein